MLIVHINIVSILKNLHSLKTFLSQFVRPIDVVCLCEISLNDCNLSYVICRDIIYFIVILKQMLVADRLSQQLFHIKFTANAFEWVKISLDGNEYLTIGSNYRHPSNDFKCFEEYFVNILKSLKNKQKYIIMENGKYTLRQNYHFTKYS